MHSFPIRDILLTRYASGHSTSYSLADAKQACLEMGAACKAVTCEYNGNDDACTIRASATLVSSQVRETTYTPSASCGDTVQGNGGG